MGEGEEGMKGVGCVVEGFLGIARAGWGGMGFACGGGGDG